MDTAKDLLNFKFQNEEVRIQNLMMQLENFFLDNPEQRLREPSQSVYLLFRFQKMYEIWVEEFDVKEKALFPFFRKYFPKRDRELTALSDQLHQLKESLREMIILIHQTFLKDNLLDKEFTQNIEKITKNGREVTFALKKYFESEIQLFHQELLRELREDEAALFFRKVVQLQNNRLNLKSKAYRGIQT